MDMGYDAEWMHEAVRDASAKVVIPVWGQKPGFGTRGGHRRCIRKEFESGPAQQPYGRRGKTETAFSGIKETFGSSVGSHSGPTRERYGIPRPGT